MAVRPLHGRPERSLAITDPNGRYRGCAIRAIIDVMRVEAGAVVDEFDLPGIGHVVARHTRTRTPDGGVTWACMFSIAAPGTTDLSVVHRLSAPNLAEGRRSVRHAVEFLAGRALTPLQVEPEQPTRSSHPSRRATDGGRFVTPAGRREFTPLTDTASRTPVFDLPTAPEPVQPPATPVDPVPAPLS